MLGQEWMLLAVAVSPWAGLSWDTARSLTEYTEDAFDPFCLSLPDASPGQFE